ncbi:MAG: hypothetical protein AUI01_00160 [Ktedonobacter sp. 13_2_20CM_2_56_8]|nr:MAG: hypothetical protein AUI01_00160 [Ktedonobacter sp. 13_2_20CM_2_56_8]
MVFAASKGVDDVGKPYIKLVILSAAKDLARGTQRSFAALRMTVRTALKSAHGESYLQMSVDCSPSIRKALTARNKK